MDSICKKMKIQTKNKPIEILESENKDEEEYQFPKSITNKKKTDRIIKDSIA